MNTLFTGEEKLTLQPGPLLPQIPNYSVRALSWKQPYAELMLHGKIETRVWGTKYRGLVLICASKQPYGEKEMFKVSGTKQFRRIIDTIGLESFDGKYFANIPYGKAIAIAELHECRKMRPGEEDKCFVKYQEELYCHVYRNVMPIQPFAWQGSQGWKTLTNEEKAKIILL